MTLFWIVTSICAGFTAVASLVLWVSFLRGGLEDDPALATRLLVKGVLFGALTVVAFRWIRVQGRTWQRLRLANESKSETPTDSQGRPLAGTLALFAIGLVVVPFLGSYPHLEPDESHHLIVARNVAEYGVYGSGHPDVGFTWFDSYDSVGPPVILPVALALKAGGVSLFAGRVPMAAFFLLCCSAGYLVLRPLFGTPAAIAAMAIAAAAVGSAYLGRTLYGEAPAMLFLLAGLWFWRGSIFGNHAIRDGVLAGLCFGLMILTKVFMASVAWAFLGAFLYDRLTFRRIRLVHMILPGVCAAVPLLAWLAVQSAYGTDTAQVTAGRLSMYRHNLMFGLDPVPTTLGWIGRHPLTFLVSVVAMIAAAPVVFYRRYDPPGAVLFLFAPFIAYWWIFFTTGNIPRYLWYCIVIAALFTGPLAWMLIRGTRRSSRPTARYACMVFAALVIGPYAINTFSELRGIYGRNDMADEYALAEFVRALPQDEPVSTTFYPVERTLNLLADRHVARVPAAPESIEGGGPVIVDAVSQKMLLNDVDPAERFGRYAVVKGLP